MSATVQARVATDFDASPTAAHEVMPIETAEQFEARVAGDFAAALVPEPCFKLARFRKIRPDVGAQYLVKGLLPRAGLAVIWGRPKCGKSFWTFDMLMHVALGWDYRGHRVSTGTVVYCALEGALGFKNRVEAFRQAKLSEGANVDPPFFLMATPLSLVAAQAQLVADIRAQVGDTTPVAVCVDTLNRSIAGSENDDEAMGDYVRAADAIRAAFDCLVIIVHHSGYSAERPRGHSSLVGALDVQISVKRDAAGNIVAELEQSKDGATGLQFVSRLKVVEIGCDEDGDPVTSCTIEAADLSNGTDKLAKVDAKRVIPKSAQTALRALEKAIAEVGDTAPRSNHIPPAARVVTVDQWRSYAYQMGVSASDEGRAKRLAFQRAIDALVTGGAIGIWEPHVWKLG